VVDIYVSLAERELGVQWRKQGEGGSRSDGSFKRIIAFTFLLKFDPESAKQKSTV
jgi:hypothetical protein